MDMKWNSGSAHIYVFASSKRSEFGIFNLELIDIARSNETSSASLNFVGITSKSDLADAWELSGGVLAVLSFDDLEDLASSEFASLACRVLDVNALTLAVAVAVRVLFNWGSLKAVKSAGSLLLEANFQGETRGDQTLSVFDAAVLLTVANLALNILDLRNLGIFNNHLLKAVKSTGSFLL